ncbi:hypothetical protein TVH25_16575, partial [Rhodococcus sp. 7Tela_A2]
MEPLRCAECSAQVLVQKNSWEHTSIQWNADARRRCPQVQDDAGRDGRPRAPPRGGPPPAATNPPPAAAR